MPIGMLTVPLPEDGATLHSALPRMAAQTLIGTLINEPGLLDAVEPDAGAAD